MRALDHKGENRLPASAVVTALKRMGIELLKKPKDVEMALRVFEVRGGIFCMKTAFFFVVVVVVILVTPIEIFEESEET